MMISLIALATVLGATEAGPNTHRGGVSTHAISYSGPDSPQRRLTLGGDCQGCNFSSQNLAGAKIEDGRFEGANFSDSQLLGAQITNVNLSGANFSQSQLREARFNDVNFTGANFDNASLIGTRLQSVSLTGAHMASASFQNAVLVQVDLNAANLRDTSFASSILREVRASTVSARDSDFRGATLNLTQWNRSELRSVRFDGARIVESSFPQADLREVVFTGAQITNSDFTSADLRGAVMEGTVFHDVNFSGADLRGVSGLEHAQFMNVCPNDTHGILTRYIEESCQGHAASQAPTSEPRRVWVERQEEATERLSFERDIQRLEAEREHLRIARLAFEEALRNLENHENSPHGLNNEAFNNARQGVREAARELDEAEADLERRLAEARLRLDEAQLAREFERAQRRSPDQIAIKPQTYERQALPPNPAREAPPLPEIRPAPLASPDAPVVPVSPPPTNALAERIRNRVRNQVRARVDDTFDGAAALRETPPAPTPPESPSRTTQSSDTETLRMNLGDFRMYAGENGFEMRAGDVVMEFNDEGGYIIDGDEELLVINPGSSACPAKDCPGSHEDHEVHDHEHSRH